MIGMIQMEWSPIFLTNFCVTASSDLDFMTMKENAPTARMKTKIFAFLTNATNGAVKISIIPAPVTVETCVLLSLSVQVTDTLLQSKIQVSKTTKTTKKKMMVYGVGILNFFFSLFLGVILVLLFELTGTAFDSVRFPIIFHLLFSFADFSFQFC
jgi:hypothetical protein